MLIAGGALLALAARLTPDPRGVGTHEQLGLAPCGFHLRTGLPCPTCGMTTAYAYAVRGNWLRAFLVQPAGLGLALLTFGAVCAGAWLAVGGPLPPGWLGKLDQLWLVWLAVAVFVGAWGYKLVLALVERSATG